MQIKMFCVVSGLLLLIWATPVTATPTITVCAAGCDFTTIRAALAAPDVQPGATLQLVDAVYTEAGLVIAQEVTIAGRDQPVIVQAHAEPDKATDRVFMIEPGAKVVFKNLIIRHGSAPKAFPPSGGGICNYGTLLLDHCQIRNNRATDGGGILSKGDLTLVNCVVSQNRADGVHPDLGLQCGSGGGIKSETGPFKMVNSTVTQNEAAEKGGGLYISCKSDTELTNCTISNNHALQTGGGIDLRGTLTLKQVTIRDNTVNGIGGGLHILGKLMMSATVIANNRRNDCYLVEKHPYKGSGAILSNTESLIADQSCSSAYHGDQPTPPAIGANADKVQN